MIATIVIVLMVLLVGAPFILAAWITERLEEWEEVLEEAKVEA